MRPSKSIRVLGDSAVDRAKRVIVARLPDGQPTVDEVAAEMLLSGRSLQRRLREEGTTFRGVMSEVRRDLADGKISAAYARRWHRFE